ncbi:MAG: GNAT family N-acetyltransferase [Anaerolineales bacterium]|nr:GNAT family N-acetyltransferase [Anaerolineales bacterium]
MNRNRQLAIRNLAPAQHESALRLMHSARHVHRHLDWLDEQSYLSAGPSMAAWEQDEPVALLVCPPEAPGTAWIRIFSVRRQISLSRSFQQLWTATRASLQAENIQRVACMPIGAWFSPLLEEAGFSITDHVIFYEQDLPGALSTPDPAIRCFKHSDLKAVQAVDEQAFSSIWRHAEAAVGKAVETASYTTVLEVDSRIVGYQISTENTFGAHLARLAVLPDIQNQGIGSRLVQDLLSHFSRMGMFRVTVNTQNRNLASRHVYEKLGFQLMDLRYPVYDIRI